MAFAGLSSITKFTKLYSDHFDKSAYEDSNASKIKRYLRKTGVPCRIVSTDKVQSVSYPVAKDETQLNLQKQSCVSNVSNISRNNSLTQVLQEQITQQTVFSNTQFNDHCTSLKRKLPLCNITDISPSKKLYAHNGASEFKAICEKSQTNLHDTTMKRCLPDTMYSENPDVSPSKKLCPSNIFESDPAKDVASNLKSNEARKNMKRHMPYIDVSNIPPTKQFRFYDGPQPMCMSRIDFATDEAWSRFLKFTIYKQRQAASCRKKNQRKLK